MKKNEIFARDETFFSSFVMNYSTFSRNLKLNERRRMLAIMFSDNPDVLPCYISFMKVQNASMLTYATDK